MRIGTVEIPSKLALAPMAGVTDAAFRQICSELGAGYTVTELISSKALCYHDQKTFSLLTQFPGEHPAAVQIFGSDPVCMAEAAQIAMEHSGADILDINMGCPMGKIVNNGDGAALMKDPDLAGRIGEAVVKALPGTPVTANGDIWKPEDAQRILLHTGADMAMIGRGCFGNPWIFQQAQAVLEGRPVPPLPPLAERCETAVRQIRMAAAYKGERVAVLEARKQYCWYLKGISHANYYKEQIVQMNTLEDVDRITRGIQRDLQD